MANSEFSGTSKGEVVYNESILKGIVAIAVSHVDGVVIKADKKGKTSFGNSIKIVSEKGGIFVSVTVTVMNGYSIPDVAYNIQHGIRQNVENMSKYKLKKINVYVNDVVFEENK